MSSPAIRPIYYYFPYPPCRATSYNAPSTNRVFHTRKSSTQYRTRTRPLVKKEVRRDPATVPETEFPHDFGLFPGTFIMPSGPRKPSFFLSPVRRARLEWHRLKQRPMEFASLVGYKFGHAVGKKPRLELRKVVSTALALHQRMYTATAEGDKDLLKEICCEGLLKRLAKRMDARSPDESTRWTLHKYLGFSRVVSSRANPLPRKNSALRQVVVKVRSKQSLALWRSSATHTPQVVEGTDAIKEMVEYLVLQRRIFEGVEGPWRIWGTTQETGADEVLGKSPSKLTAEHSDHTVVE